MRTPGRDERKALGEDKAKMIISRDERRSSEEIDLPRDSPEKVVIGTATSVLMRRIKVTNHVKIYSQQREKVDTSR
jgi:hypothetical protein